MKNNHETYLKIARLFADNSTCCSKKTGCVIVREGRIISTGYNGVPSGQMHCDKYWLTGEFIDQTIQDLQLEVNARVRFGISPELIIKESNGLFEHNDDIIGIKCNRKKLIEHLNQKGFKKIFDREEHHKWSLENELHAEQNALMACCKNGIATNGADMYMTISPCKTCALLIVQAGIKSVFFEVEYDLSAGFEILKKNNIGYHNINLNS